MAGVDYEAAAVAGRWVGGNGGGRVLHLSQSEGVGHAGDPRASHRLYKPRQRLRNQQAPRFHSQRLSLLYLVSYLTRARQQIMRFSTHPSRRVGWTESLEVT